VRVAFKELTLCNTILSQIYMNEPNEVETAYILKFMEDV
jgi:hypothetical protein